MTPEARAELMALMPIEYASTNKGLRPVVPVPSSEAVDRLAAFVDRLVAAEREACAKLAEGGAPDAAMNDLSSPPYCLGFNDAQEWLAAEIRRRPPS